MRKKKTISIRSTRSVLYERKKNHSYTTTGRLLCLSILYFCYSSTVTCDDEQEVDGEDDYGEW